MLTPDTFAALPPEERRQRLLEGAAGLPGDGRPVVRLARALGRAERSVEGWLQRPETIPFWALALLEAWAILRAPGAAAEAMQAAGAALDRARDAVRVAARRVA